MLTTYFVTIQGLKVVLWCDTRDAGHRQLATAVNYEDNVPYSPIQYGGL